MRPGTPLFAAIASSGLLSVAGAQVCDTLPLVESIDSGNTGKFGALALGTDSTPIVGGSFELHVESGHPNAHGCVLYSFVESPQVLAEFGCVFHPAQPLTAVLFDLDPFGTVDGLLSVPSISPALCGSVLIAQAVAFDPLAPGGVGVSNALRIHIGDEPSTGFAYLHDVAGAVAVQLVGDDGVPMGLHPGSPFPTGGFASPGSLFQDDNDLRRSMIEVGGVLYATNSGSHDVSALRIEEDGSLSSLPGSPFPSGGFTPRSLAKHPTKDLLYVTHDTNGVIGILAIGADGTLSEAFPPASTGDNGMVNLVVDPAGAALWTSSRYHAPGGWTPQFLSAFHIDGDGDLTHLGPLGPSKPWANLVLTPSGEQLYAVTALAEQSAINPMGIYGYDVQSGPANDLALVEGSPFPNTTSSPYETQDAVVTPDGRHLYVLNAPYTASPEWFVHIQAYSIEESGALTPLGITDLTGLWFGRILSVSEDGKRLYTASTGVNVFEIDDDGGLTLVGSSPTSFGAILTAGAVFVP